MVVGKDFSEETPMPRERGMGVSFVIRESERLSPLACIGVTGISAVHGSMGEQGTRTVHGFTSLC